jgi:hypothetical protein
MKWTDIGVNGHCRLMAVLVSLNAERNTYTAGGGLQMGELEEQRVRDRL